MLEHKVNDLTSQLNLLNPQTVHLLNTRMTELSQHLNELKNLYSNPASSLNRVLDSLIRKVQDIEASFVGSARKSIKVNEFGPPKNAMPEQDDVLSHSVLSDRDKL